MSEDVERYLKLNPPCSSSSSSAVAFVNKSRIFKSSTPPCPEHVLENVLQFLTSSCDRNAVSLVCRSWYRVEAYTRFEVFIGNCYSISPARLTHRFKRVRSLVLKGKSRFADFNLMPPNWGAQFAPWVAATAKAYPWLEKVHLKRMFVTDDDLAFLAESFHGFKELTLVCCEGFATTFLKSKGGTIGQEQRQKHRRFHNWKRRNHDSTLERSVAGGGVILGGVATTFIKSKGCFVL